MNRIKYIGLVVFALIISISYASAVPEMINFQGKLRNSTGSVLNGDYAINFTIYDDATAGDSLWSENVSIVINDGVFNILLGSTNNISLNFTDDYFLGVNVEDDGEMSPRQRIAAVGYSLRSKTAENLSSVNGVYLQTTGVNRMVIDTSGNVGIGIDIPANLLNVAGDFNATGNVYLGDASSDTITFNGVVNTNIIASDNSKDLGSAGNYWSKLYVDEIIANNITGGNINGSGTVSETFTINTDNLGDDEDDMFLIFERGSSTINAVLSWDSGNKYFDFNQDFNIQGNLTVTGNITASDSLIATRNIIGAGNFIVDSSGNVGIGTTSPGEKLEVIGNMSISENLTIKGNQTIEDDLTVSGRIFGTINSAVWDIFSLIETILSNNQANATKLDTTTSNLVLNSTELFALQSNSILNETQRVTDNTTLSAMINDPTRDINNYTGFDGNITVSEHVITLVGTTVKSWLDTLYAGIGTIFDDAGVNATQSADNASIWGFTNTLASDVIKNETERVNDNTTQEIAISELNTTQGAQQLLNGTNMNFLNLTILDSLDVGEQFNVSDNFVVLPNGNVGIGTTSPNSLLQINGTTNSLLNITNGTDDFVTVLNTGNVGIGTASPQATLDIEDTSLPQLRISGGSGGGDVVIVFSELAESAHWLVGLDDTDNRFTISETSVDPGTDSRFSILPGGNVGINNTAPTHTLEVVGTFNATASQSSIVLDEAGDINIGI